MKIWNYVFIGVFLLIFFNFAGLLVDEGSNLEIGFSRSGDTIVFNPYLLLATVVALLAGAVLGAIAIGTFTKSSTENYILVPLAIGVLAALIGVFIAIWTRTAGMDVYIRGAVALVLAPFIVGYIVALAEFFRGTD